MIIYVIYLNSIGFRRDEKQRVGGRSSRPELNETRPGHLAFAGAMLLSSTGEGGYVDGASSRRIADRQL